MTKIRRCFTRQDWLGRGIVGTLRKPTLTWLAQAVCTSNNLSQDRGREILLVSKKYQSD